MSLKEICRCGHALDTHFKQQNGTRGACLGMRCECPYYGEEEAPATPRMQLDLPMKRGRVRKPHNNVHCGCDACDAWMWSEILNGR